MDSASTSTRFYVGTPDQFSTSAFRFHDLGTCGDGKWTDLGDGNFCTSFRMPSGPIAQGTFAGSAAFSMLMISTLRGDKPVRSFDVPSTMIKDGKPMMLHGNYGYGMYTVMLGETELATSYGSCWDDDAGDWDDEALAGQDGGVLDAYGSMRAEQASYMTRISMIKEGWALQPPAAAAGAGAAVKPRAVGAKRQRGREAFSNVMKVAREAERASQLAAKAAADAGFAARKVTAAAQAAVIDLTDEDDEEEELPPTPQRPIKRAAPRDAPRAPRKMVRARKTQ